MVLVVVAPRGTQTPPPPNEGRTVAERCRNGGGMVAGGPFRGIITTAIMITRKLSKSKRLQYNEELNDNTRRRRLCCRCRRGMSMDV